MPRAKNTVHLRGKWSEEDLFDKIKFANCWVNAVSKEHGISRGTLKDYLKPFNFRGYRYCVQDGVITYLPPGVITFTCF